MKKLLEWLGYESKIHYHHRIAYVINTVALLLAVTFSFLYIFVLKFPFAVPGITGYLVSTLLVFLLLKAKRYTLSKLLILIGFLMQESSIVFFLFPVEVHFNLFFFIVAPITFFVFDYEVALERALTYLFTGTAIVLFTLSEVLPTNPMAYGVTAALTYTFAGLSAFLSLLSVTIVFYFFAVEIAKANKELNQLANTDGLTSIFNRRYFFEAGKNQFYLAQKYQRPFSLILIDLDYFKEINDTFGHLAGDSVLIELSERIKGQVRRSDVFSRYGGEEFIILLKDTRIEEGELIAEKIRHSVMSYKFEALENSDRSVTISLGVVEFSAAYSSFDEMVKAVDGALYAAKEAGRNCVKSVESIKS